MTWTERKNYDANTPWRRTAQEIDIGINDAMQENRNSPERLALDGLYLVTDAWPMLKEIGDFTEDLARDAWEDIRNKWGTGVQLWNQISKVTETSCQDEWDVIIETALPAAGSALMLLLTPHPGEILENYLEPKALRSSGRGAKDKRKVRRRKGRSGRLRRSFPRFPDVDRLIADRLPGRTAVEGRRATLPTRWTFTGINVADRFLWYWLLYEAGTTFITQWNTNLKEARFCTETFLSIFQGSYTFFKTKGTRTCPFSGEASYEITQDKNVECGVSEFALKDLNGATYNAAEGTASVSGTISVPDDLTYIAGKVTMVLEARDDAGHVTNRTEQQMSWDDGPPLKTPPQPFGLTVDMTGATAIGMPNEFTNTFAYATIKQDVSCSANP